MISDARQLRHHGVHLGLNSQASNLIVMEEAPLRCGNYAFKSAGCSGTGRTTLKGMLQIPILGADGPEGVVEPRGDML